MSNTEKNIYAADASKRYDAEIAANADSNKCKYIAALALTVSADNVFKLMSASNVRADFATNHRVSTAAIDAKALKRVDNIIKFAVNRTDKLESCANEVVRTVINFKNAGKNITLQDMKDCLTVGFKSKDKEKTALLFMKTAPKDFNSQDRHAFMTERALSTLNILSVNPNNSAEFIINDNDLYKSIAKRFTVSA